MSWKHDLSLWLGRILYRFNLITWDAYFNEAERVVCDKYNFKRVVVDGEQG